MNQQMHRAPGTPRKLLDQMGDLLRSRHYALRTEQAYVDWIRRYIVLHGKRHPLLLGAHEMETFLAVLAVERRVAASTQNQALSALLFLYREVLGVELPWLDGVTRAKRAARLPVVLSRAEVQRVLALADGVEGLVLILLYATGMRVMEGLRLPVTDVDFGRGERRCRARAGLAIRVSGAHSIGSRPATA